MEKKKKKKRCPNIQSARLSSQTKFALILVSLIFIILNVGSMMLNIYLITSFTYKEIYKLIDQDEFNELTFAENNLENIQLQFENTFKNTLLSIVNLYKEFSNETLNNDLYAQKYDSFKLTFWNGSYSEPTFDPKNNILYTCEGEDNCISNNTIKYNFYTYLGVYLETILYNKRIYMNSNKYQQILHSLIVCDYEENITFYYPGYTNETKKVNVNIIKEYVLNKIIEKIKIISMYKEILPNNLDFYDNLFLLPFYDDNDNKDYNFIENNLTYEIFNEEFLNDTDSRVNEIAFQIVPKRNNNLEFMDINLENINDNIGQIFLIVGLQGSSEIIFEKLNKQQSGLYLLRTNYLFPYELVSQGSCKKILRLGNSDPSYKNIDITTLKYLDDCFDKKTIIKKYKKLKYTTYDKILQDYSIFRNDISHTYNSNIVKLYQIIEQKYLQKNSTSYTKTITNVTSLNNVDFKIKKTYSPLNLIYQINYFYPIDNIKMDILIKSEDYSKFVLKETKKIMDKILLTGVLCLISTVVLLEIIIFFILKYFTQELNKPLDIINNPYFITGQIKEEEYENKNKSLNKANIISDNKIHIDEFKELIKSVSIALKSETEFKQKINKQEEDDMKLEMEYLNKEFEKNKIFNIMVDENKINNILEESNYSNEIIKHKTNINNVKNDSFVKKSYVFKEYVKIDEFEEFENSGENSLTIENNTIFKDENTLQNQNSFFYELFKNAFDEEYVKRIEEMKIKKENEKKKKTKFKINNTLKGEEEPLKTKSKLSSSKSKKNFFDFSKDLYSINDDEDKKLKFNDNDINSIKFEKEDKLENELNNEEKLIKEYIEGNEDKKEEENNIINENNINKDNIIIEDINTDKF